VLLLTNLLEGPVKRGFVCGLRQCPRVVAAVVLGLAIAAVSDGRVVIPAATETLAAAGAEGRWSGSTDRAGFVGVTRASILSSCRGCSGVSPTNLSPSMRSMPSVAVPIEQRLGSVSTDVLRGVRRGIRRLLRFVRWSARWWASWTLRAALFTVLVLLTPLFDRALLKTWREQGMDAVRTAAAQALAVHMRLLFDSGAPVVGKVSLVAAIIYGVASRDVMPDHSSIVGFLDDAAVVVLASRCFTMLCPDHLVEAHAFHVARHGAWLRRKSPPAHQPS